MDGKSIFAAIVGLLVLAVCLSFLFAFPVMWLWNFALVPLGVGAIGFWQAWCIMVLCQFLFKANVSVNNKS
jgi:hypothetical protein